MEKSEEQMRDEFNEIWNSVCGKFAPLTIENIFKFYKEVRYRNEHNSKVQTEY